MDIIEYNGIKYAQVIRAGVNVKTTKFYSPPESSFQFGLLAHEAGFSEVAHYHKPFVREISDLQQMFVMQRGTIAIRLYSDDGYFLQEILLSTGDAIVLIHGVHSVHVIEDFQAISVKQGPFLGMEFDKVPVEVKQ